MSQRMSDMLQLVVEILNSQRDRNDSTNVRYASACRRDPHSQRDRNDSTNVRYTLVCRRRA